jgi:hypothetical protein
MCAEVQEGAMAASLEEADVGCRSNEEERKTHLGCFIGDSAFLSFLKSMRPILAFGSPPSFEIA